MTPPRPRPLAGTVLGLVLGLGAAHGQQGNPGAADVHAVGAEVIADLDETSVTRSEPGAGLVGKWLKASGRWVEQRFEASRAEQRGPLKDTAGGRVTGQIDALGPEPRTFLVGPLLVECTDSTRLVGLTVEQLVPGAWIEARGRLTAPARLVADAVHASVPGRGEIVGPVTAEERRTDGSIVLAVLGVDVVVPVGAPTYGTDLARRPDEKRPTKHRTFSVFGRPLTIGGHVRTRTRYMRNFDLDNATRDDELDVNNRLHLEAFYFFTPHVLALVSARFVYAPDFEFLDGSRTDDKEIVRREHWLFVGDILQRVLGPGYSLQIGRQKIKEERRWWWRRNLDAVRFHYDRPKVHLELAVAEELAPEGTATRFVSPDLEGVLLNLGNAAWAWKEGHRLDFFYLYHFDHSGQHSIGQVVAPHHDDESDARLLWLGGRSSGQIGWGELGDLSYGVDGAWVGGRERVFDFKTIDPAHERISSSTSHDVGGFAIDATGTWATKAPARPALGLGYAFGSGNSAAKHGRDSAFRQTDLQRNRAPFLGVEAVRYYGELLRPELSNLHIFTAAVGFRILGSSSVELLYHFYRQDTPAPFLRSAKLDADPTGKSSLVGHEWDLVFSLREWERFEAQLIPALFLAGPAYGSFSGNLAEMVFMRLKYTF